MKEEESQIKDPDDDNMNLDARMAWLRERGVLVETAEERKQKQVVAAMRQADALAKVIAYVRVPADTSQPLQELSFQSYDGIAGDGLLDHLRPLFTKKENERVDTQLLKEHSVSTLAGSVDLPSISDSTLQSVASEANVETFSLVHPIASNNFQGINIYLDEVGMLKRLPLNKRVSDIAARAGFNPAPTFYGDIFIGRIQNKPTLRNLSFHLGADTDENAPWLRAAVTENLEYQLELNKITGRRDEQAGAAGSDGKTKEEDGYSWTQTERELEVSIPLPIDATSQQIKVKFNPKKMELMYLTKSHVEILLFERVDVDGCTWTLESGITTKKLIITMEKLEEAFWPRIRD